MTKIEKQLLMTVADVLMDVVLALIICRYNLYLEKDKLELAMHDARKESHDDDA